MGHFACHCICTWLLQPGTSRMLKNYSFEWAVLLKHFLYTYRGSPWQPSHPRIIFLICYSWCIFKALSEKIPRKCEMSPSEKRLKHSAQIVSCPWCLFWKGIGWFTPIKNIIFSNAKVIMTCGFWNGSSQKLFPPNIAALDLLWDAVYWDCFIELSFPSKARAYKQAQQCTNTLIHTK